jgi:hypothetical protein
MQTQAPPGHRLYAMAKINQIKKEAKVLHGELVKDELEIN